MNRGNRLFESLGPAIRDRLRPHVDLVSLAKGRVLCQPGDVPRHAYFPLDGMISLLGTTDDGRSLEVAITGTEGFAGVSLVFNAGTSPCQVLVQIEGTAHRVHADAFVREFHRCEHFQAVALTYAQHVTEQLVKSAVCHTFHTLTQRVCRWLLVSRDCVQSNTIELTQEFIANMLGVSRPKVSETLVTLEQRKAIHQGHGRIHIVDPKGLLHWSCDCYRPATDHAPVVQPLHHVK